MSRRSSKSRRRSERARQREIQKRNRLILIGAGAALLIGAAAFLIISGGGGAARAEAPPQERLDRDPLLGESDGPVLLVEYGAYSCSSCRQWHQAGVIEGILAQFPGQVQFVFRDFPVITPTYDRLAAQAAQCTLDQGDDAFWAFHDAMYTTNYMTARTAADFGLVADSLGLDGDAVRECTDSQTHEETVLYDLERGYTLGLRGTPSFLVNGRQVLGGPDAIVQAIIQELGS